MLGSMRRLFLKYYRTASFPHPTRLLLQRKLDQLREDLCHKLAIYSQERTQKEVSHRSAESGAGIPALRDGEAISAARRDVAPDDVGEGRVGLGVDPRVQEAQRGLTGADAGVVDERDDTGGQRRRRAGAGDRAQRVVPEESEVETLCRDIGVSAALWEMVLEL
jgi:hypothetical protein